MPSVVDPAVAQSLQDPQWGRSGAKSIDVRREAQPSEGYQNTLLGLGAMAGLRRYTRGNGLIYSAAGLGGMHTAGAADMTFNPAGSLAQTQVDSHWLSQARENDMYEPPPSFRKRSGQPSQRASFPKKPDARPSVVDDTFSVKASAWQGRALGQALQACQFGFLAPELEVRLRTQQRPTDRRKQSAPTKISSPLDSGATVSVDLVPRPGGMRHKVSNSLQAVLREMTGAQPFPIPGISAPGIVSDLVGNRPQWLGGPTPGERLLRGVKDLVVRDELVFNASGIPIGKKKVLLPGMPGMLLRVPLALGGLWGVNAAWGAYKDRKHRQSSDARFGEALASLQGSEGSHHGLAQLLDPRAVDPADPQALEDHKRAKQLARKSFDLLDKYAPTVSKDPTLAAGYIQSFLLGSGDNLGTITPDQWMSQVNAAVRLENDVQKQQTGTVFDGVSSLVSRMMEPV